MYTIYVVTNKINGKYYVGQTTKTGAERWKDHYWTSNKKDYFHYAIRKYGKENFEVQDVAVFNTCEEVDQAEKLWILLTKSYDRKIGYNSTMGGDRGAIPNEETRAKIGAYSKTRVHSAETRKKMSEAHMGTKNHFFGKKHDRAMIEATKIKLSENSKGEKSYWFGKKQTAEHRQKISRTKRALFEAKKLAEQAA